MDTNCGSSILSLTFDCFDKILNFLSNIDDVISFSLASKSTHNVILDFAANLYRTASVKELVTILTMENLTSYMKYMYIKGHESRNSIDYRWYRSYFKNIYLGSPIRQCKVAIYYSIKCNVSYKDIIVHHLKNLAENNIKVTSKERNEYESFLAKLLEGSKISPFEFCGKFGVKHKDALIFMLNNNLLDDEFLKLQFKHNINDSGLVSTYINILKNNKYKYLIEWICENTNICHGIVFVFSKIFLEMPNWIIKETYLARIENNFSALAEFTTPHKSDVYIRNLKIILEILEENNNIKINNSEIDAYQRYICNEYHFATSGDIHAYPYHEQILCILLSRQ